MNAAWPWVIWGTRLDASSMEHTKHPINPLPVNLAARCLRVSSQWLREEVEAGRVPALIAGRTVLVHVPTVAAILTERSKGKGVTRAE